MFGRRKQGRAPQPVPATAAWPLPAETSAPAGDPPATAPSANDEAAPTSVPADVVAPLVPTPSTAPLSPATAEPAEVDVPQNATQPAPSQTDGTPSGAPSPAAPHQDRTVEPTPDNERATSDMVDAEPTDVAQGAPSASVPAGGQPSNDGPSPSGVGEPGDRAASWAATWGIGTRTESAPAASADGATDTVAVGDVPESGAHESGEAAEHASGRPEQHDGASSPVSRETEAAGASEAGGSASDNGGDASASPPPQDPDGDMTTHADLDPDEQRRAALVRSLPAVTDDTPLMAELQQDARRRIELRGRRFPRPTETRIVTVANQKGGVGKTTTTVNLAAALAQSGLNVLVLDNDPQGNASTALGIEHRAGTPSIYEVLVEGAPMAEAVQESPDVPNLWCLPATIDLSGAEIELVSMVARETRLRSALDTYLQWRIDTGLERIDYVFVDCPPSLGLLTVNAFVVAREVLIPIQCEYYALEGLSQLLKTIQLIQAHLNRDLHVSTILLTMYDARTNLAQQVASEVREHFPERTLRTTVPRSVRISEAPSYGQTVMTYDAGSSGALAYLEAAREIAERGAATPDVTRSSNAAAESGAEEDR